MDFQIIGTIAVIGVASGNLLFYDINKKEILYGFGAMQEGSVQKIYMSKNKE